MLRTFLTTAVWLFALGVSVGSMAAETADLFCRKFLSNEYASCMATRAYIDKAKAVVAGNGLCMTTQAPRGDVSEFFEDGDEKIIQDAMILSLSKPCRKQE